MTMHVIQEIQEKIKDIEKKILPEVKTLEDICLPIITKELDKLEIRLRRIIADEIADFEALLLPKIENMIIEAIKNKI